jgi:hypothetical protein
MSHKQTDPKKDQSKHHLVPPIDMGDAKATHNIKETQDSANPTYQAQTKPPVYKRVVAFFGNDAKQPNVANIISLGMLFVTAFLAYYTYSVFNQTTKQTKAATDAAKAAGVSATVAQQTLNADTLYNNKTLNAQKIQSDTSDSLNKRSEKRQGLQFGLQQKSLSQQITSLNETQKEFEIENRPLVQILDFRFDSLEANHHMILKYDFINYGKQPVKCLGNIVQVCTETKNKKPNIISNNWIVSKMGSYLSGNATSQDSWKSNDTCTQIGVKSFKDGKYGIYLIGTFSFINTVTFTKSEYKYSYRISYINGSFNTEGVQDTTINTTYIKAKKSK